MKPRIKPEHVTRLIAHVRKRDARWRSRCKFASKRNTYETKKKVA